jgi:DnaJ-class molecular chaperone
MPQNPYLTLGLAPNPQPSLESSKAAYKRMAAMYHPDRGGDPEKFVLVTKAWEQIQKQHLEQDQFEDIFKDLAKRFRQ